MSRALIEELAAAAGALRTAMQTAETAEIEKVLDRFRISLEAVKHVESWNEEPALKAKLAELMAELDSSHMLACLLGDRTGQMQGLLASRDPDAPQPLYKPAR
jgi:hypothetical protein